MTEDNRPMCKIAFNHDVVNGLWDTGSSLSLLTYYYFKRNFPHIEITNQANTLRSATGHYLKILGVAMLPFRIPGLVTGTFPFIIINGMTNDCILGFDFFKKFLIYIHPPTGHAFRNINPHLVPAGTPHNTNCYTKHAVKIEPREEKLITAITDCPDGDYYINSDNHLIPNTLAILTPAVVTVTSGKTKLLVTNPSLTPLEIEQTAPLGTLVYHDNNNTYNIDSISSILSPPPQTDTQQHITHKIDFTNIPTYIRQNYINLLKRHETLMNDDSTDIGKCTLIKQHIELKDKNKIACTPPHRIPPPLQPVVTHFVEKLLAAGVIQHSKSPFSSPLMLIKKAQADKNKPLMEQYRVVNDFRKLNENIVKDSYPMQNIYSLIDEVAAAKIASVIDLRSAFFMQELDEQSRRYTSFPVPGMGQFEYTRSPQGLVNSPSAFQRLLDALMIDIPNVKVYIDDIVIYSDTWESHLKTLQQVLEKLSKHNFKCSVKKLQLACGTINYLGYEIRPGKSIQPGKAKTEAIHKWQPPTDITQIKQFLGLCSFFRRTIPNYSHIAHALTRLTRKDTSYSKGPLPKDALDAFNKLKSALVSRPTLAPPNFAKDFILTTDASKFAIGGVLTQKDDENNEKPIAYYSRCLKDAELKKAPFHLEYIAMVSSIRHFKPYLAHKHFTLRTDHKPLTSINKVQGDSVDRIKLELLNYDFTVEYMKGSEMIADGLSRQIQVQAIEKNKFLDEFSRNDIVKLQKADTVCKALVCFKQFNSLPIDNTLAKIAQEYKNNVLIKNKKWYM